MHKLESVFDQIKKPITNALFLRQLCDQLLKIF
jgi:hypothetical protein